MSDAGAFDRRRYSTLHGYAERVLEIAAELELERINFIGRSVSSMVGGLASIKRPELFESLLMESRRLAASNTDWHLASVNGWQLCSYPAVDKGV